MEKRDVAKQRILSSIYPEKLIFEKTTYRTPKMLNVITLLCKYNVAFKGNKKGDFTDQFSNSLIQELQILSNLKAYLLSV